MSSLDTRSLLLRFLSATTAAQYRDVLSTLGDNEECGLDESFGPYKLKWRPFGDRQSNISTINLATKPGRSLAERITNAIDALFEERAGTSNNPTSATEAAQKWFGRPEVIGDANLTEWYRGKGIDRRIHVALLPSGVAETPTIDVVDSGVGIKVEDFPTTILSLQQGNKISKFYQIGAWGQGGSATLGFCSYALIVSRHKENQKRVGYTIIRILNLNDSFKEDCFAYLTLANDTGLGEVLSCDYNEDIRLYENTTITHPPLLKQGTLVRHIGFRLEDLNKSFQAAPGNMWHFLNVAMFDSLVPFRLLDLRDDDNEKHRDEVIGGTRNRLISLSKRSDIDGDIEAKAATQLRYYRKPEYIVPAGATHPCVSVEYWVILSHRKVKDSIELRSSSSELYLQPNHPIVGTLNGQNQGERTGQLIRDSGLPLLSRHMAIHIDATNADRKTKRELFATTREGFKEGPVLTSILEYLKKILQDDETLAQIEREITAKIAKKDAGTTEDEVKRQIVSLLKEAGFEVQKEGQADGEGQGDKKLVVEKREGRFKEQSPLPTLPYPEVTKFEIVSPKDCLEVRVGDARTLLVETNASSEYDRRGAIGIRFEPSNLEVATYTPLSGGRLRWRVRPTQTASANDEGQIIATITRPNGSQISATLPYKVLPQLEKEAKKSPGFVPPFDIQPIHPEEQPELWATLWPESIWPEVSGEGRKDVEKVAYKPLQVRGETIVYYSTVFQPYKDMLEKLKLVPSKLAHFETNYKVWIGYHAIMQENSKTAADLGLEENVKEIVMENERRVVARVQVKQALRLAETIEKYEKRAALVE
jgi:hypothetical protein